VMVAKFAKFWQHLKPYALPATAKYTKLSTRFSKTDLFSILEQMQKRLM
jgi:hypothetical protein